MANLFSGAQRAARRRMSANILTDTSTTAEYVPGERYSILDQTYGEMEFVYIKNDSGGAYAEGLGVMFKDAAVNYSSTNLSGANISRARFIGVALGAIADQSFGWIQTKGPVNVKAVAGGILANASLKCAASGEFDDGTALTEETIAFSGAAILLGALGVGILR